VNHREKNFTQDRLARRMAAIEGTIDRYLAELDRADRQHEVTGVTVAAAKVERLKRGIATLQQKLKSLSALDEKMRASGERQISLTDPDARAMTSQSHSAYVVGYNVQSAVDTQNHLIVAHEVSNVGIDKGHLSSMASQARDALDAKKIEVLADRGYFKSEEIAACEDAGIEAYVPKPLTSNARAKGRFEKDDFVYDPEHDRYLCPAGQRLTYRMSREEDGRNIRFYWTNTCEACLLKSGCTTAKERRVRRWERENVLERVQARLDRRSDAMIVRRSTVEHPFGSIKAWMGATHFRMKTLKHVATEMALHVLAYNLKRVMAILGVRELLRAM
jgi:DNA-binding Lrp family transcriptional regulator